MRAKAYLEQIGRYKKNISRKKKEIEELVELKEEMTEECFKKTLIDLEHKVQKKMIKYAEAKHKIVNEINEMKNEKHADILYSCYVERKSLVEIAAAEHYTYGYIKTLHGHALKDFSETIMLKKRK